MHRKLKLNVIILELNNIVVATHYNCKIVPIRLIRVNVLYNCHTNKLRMYNMSIILTQKHRLIINKTD